MHRTFEYSQLPESELAMLKAKKKETKPIAEKIYPKMALEYIERAALVAQELIEGKPYKIFAGDLYIMEDYSKHVRIDEFPEIEKEMERVEIDSEKDKFYSGRGLDSAFMREFDINIIGVKGWEEKHRLKFASAILNGIIDFARNEDNYIMTSGIEITKAAMGAAWD
jgi:hypothetical protein